LSTAKGTLQALFRISGNWLDVYDVSRRCPPGILDITTIFYHEITDNAFVIEVDPICCLSFAVGEF
jgi:hypothetical protein